MSTDSKWALNIPRTHIFRQHEKSIRQQLLTVSYSDTYLCVYGNVTPAHREQSQYVDQVSANTKRLESNSLTRGWVTMYFCMPANGNDSNVSISMDSHVKSGHVLHSHREVFAFLQKQTGLSYRTLFLGKAKNSKVLLAE